MKNTPVPPPFTEAPADWFGRAVWIVAGFIAGAVAVGAAMTLTDPAAAKVHHLEESTAEAEHRARQAEDETAAIRGELIGTQRQVAEMEAELAANDIAKAPTAQATARFTPDSEMQAKRSVFIESLQDNGIATKIEKPGSIPKMWVTAKFLEGQFDAKNSICNAVYAFYFPNPADADLGNHLQIIDSVSGNQVGTYSPLGGLEME